MTSTDDKPNCKRKHSAAVKNRMEILDKSQAKPGRHKCARCAYELGYLDALARVHEALQAVQPPE